MTHTNRLLCAFVIVLFLLVSINSFADEYPSQNPVGPTTETQPPASVPPAEEYKFEASEIQKKPYHIGGYLEFRPILYGLDKDNAIYKLKFLDRK
ncbi:MAG: hypothetical protein WBN53_11085, partial [Thermodesulfobacteriota bacterium]